MFGVDGLGALCKEECRLSPPICPALFGRVFIA